ncbi:VanZ like protein [Cytobacillus firmus]|uniref:VanZ like protein n=2 Tax=Cytobacillus TaxID=2675230 RepID=A0A366JMB6_CYTFI|nr:MULTISPECIES: VanZ family protein [Cytobacillus]RBP88238.1 VanZ like protein [Cytobacillus firmus]TDX38311.1 VanZ like protein [Cytobacillus oceanisediminis]
MTKKTALILTTILFLPLLIAYLWFYGRFGHYLLRLMFGMAAFDSIWPAAALFLLTSLVISANIYQLCRGQFYKWFVWLEGILYFLSSMNFILFKTYGDGIARINLQWRAVFWNSNAETLANILIFIPIGWMLYLLFRGFWRTMFVGLPLVLLIELSQYVFRLGVTDVVDVMTNMTGILSGFLIFALIRLFGVKFYDRGIYWAFRQEG